jgi:hypothetical protein
MPKGQAIKYTPEQLDYIKSNCNLGRKELTLKANLNSIQILVLIQSNHCVHATNGTLVELAVLKRETSHGIRAPRVFANLTQEALKKVVIAGI